MYKHSTEGELGKSSISDPQCIGIHYSSRMRHLTHSFAHTNMHRGTESSPSGQCIDYALHNEQVCRTSNRFMVKTQKKYGKRS